MDLCMYASRRSPKPLLNEITNYKPKNAVRSGSDGWNEIFTRVKKYEDDGHGSKLVRALAHGEEICKPYDNREEFRIKKGMWLQLGNMGKSRNRYLNMQKLTESKKAIDSVEDSGDTWVRSAGFDEAWTKYVKPFSLTISFFNWSFGRYEDRPRAQL